jgi:hypothetical protein
VAKGDQQRGARGRKVGEGGDHDGGPRSKQLTNGDRRALSPYRPHVRLYGTYQFDRLTRLNLNYELADEVVS